MRFALFLAAFTACGPAEVIDQVPPTPIPATFMTCEEAEDCVVLELGCCDHCNGGRAVSVRVDSADDVQATYAESCTPGMACTQRGCAPLTADCAQGQCITVEGEL
jgi:hypothetical protein